MRTLRRAGFMPSKRGQREFEAEYNRWIDEQRAKWHPEDEEILCIGCEWNRVLNYGQMCEDCREGSR